MGNISPCNHEEGDYRSVLHCYNMSKCELNTMITTADTDNNVYKCELNTKMITADTDVVTLCLNVS